jgi:regulatory protein
MKITRMARQPRRERVRIHVDGEEEPRLELALDLVLRAGLAVGDVLDPARVTELEREDEVMRAREGALRLLSHRARSVVELRRRLERNDVPPAVVNGTLEWLEERGYVDDTAFAEAFVRDRLRLRPRGRSGLIQELRRRGVAEEVAAAAADQVMAAEEVDDLTLAREAARAWARRNASLLSQAHRPEQRARARRRLYAHLARRGFGPGEVSAGVAAALDD